MFPDAWHALGREAGLAAGQIATGVTALGKASYTDKGRYAQAFFGLSIGLERMAKLILIADHCIENQGRFLTDRELRAFGHDVQALLTHCEPIARKYRDGKEFATRPSSAIHDGIVLTLSEFGKISRYYNLDLVAGGRGAQLPEPIGAWWKRVGVPILEKHYAPAAKKRDADNAAAIGALLGPVTLVLHHDETGNQITDLAEASALTGATRIVQKYGQLYSLQLVRWLAFTISELSHVGAYRKRIEALLGLNEPFIPFMNDDSYLKSRTSWMR
jgi:hypothetical protein